MIVDKNKAEPQKGRKRGRESLCRNDSRPLSSALKALAAPDVKERLASLGADIVATSPEETAAFFKTELAKYEKVAKAANIRTD